MHLLMDFTIVKVISNRLKASIMLTAIDFERHWSNHTFVDTSFLLLSEVKSFRWEHFRANRQLEILV